MTRHAAPYALGFALWIALALIAFVASLVLVLFGLMAIPGGYFGSPTWAPTIRNFVLAGTAVLVAIAAAVGAWRTARASSKGAPRG